MEANLTNIDGKSKLSIFPNIDIIAYLCAYGSKFN